ncbi:DUF6434 domain-containing protein [Enterococcus sp. LJL128]|uniref:DUF6434 domain-containing protein n=1 Tax=Enterococcus sp. LJL51 TaxID=3416656 RepID=UPI003CE8F378
MERPILSKTMDSAVFLDFYYLKEELAAFCREEGLQTTGNKEALTKRIAHYLATGEKIRVSSSPKQKPVIHEITLDKKIEENFVCSEIHRAFYKEQIGKGFTFNVQFQNWLKQHAGKTYEESIQAYKQIMEDKKQNTTKIENQFEYNTYIRDFFADNQERTLQEAIKCWKNKKAKSGHNKYEKKDTMILNKN